MVEHKTVEECENAFLERFTVACGNERRWMAAVWYVGEDGEVYLDKTKRGFPREKLLESLELLDNMIREEMGLNRAPSRLPTARPLRLNGDIPKTAKKEEDQNEGD